MANRGPNPRAAIPRRCAKATAALVILAAVAAFTGTAQAFDSAVTDATIDSGFWRYDPNAAVTASSQRKIDRSTARPQTIGSAELTRIGGGRVRLAFEVSYPRVGTGRPTGWARVTVWNSPKRARPIGLFGKRVRARAGSSVRIRMTLDGDAGRRLRAALAESNSRAMRMATINSFHGRNLDRDDAVDHASVVTRVLARAMDPPGPAGANAAKAPSPVGGTTSDVEIANQTSTPFIATSAPVSCMYSNGAGNSELTAINGALFPPGSSATYEVQNDASFGGGGPGDGYSWNDSTSFKSGTSIVISPAYVDANIYSPEVAGLLYTANSYYEQENLGIDGDTYIPTTFTEAYGILSSRFNSDCWSATSLFTIGADAYPTSQASGPTLGHTAAVFEIEDSDDVEERASLDSTLIEQMSNYGGATGLAISSSDSTITVVDQGSAGCVSQAGPGWMECVLAPGSTAEQTQLSSIVFPGSHDSGTPNLASSPDWILNPVPPSVSTDVCSHYQVVFDFIPTDVYDAASTQSLVMRQQLDLGIRYLDLRVAEDPGNGDDPGGTWRILHSMFTQSTLQSELATIANWLAAHPDEVVVLDFNHVCPWIDNGEYDTSGLIDALTAEGPSGQSICDRSYVTSGSPEDIPVNTLADVRNSGRNAIVLLDGNYSYSVPSGCGAYPFYDQTQNNPSGQAGNVGENHLWPNNAGPGADACSQSSVNESYAQAIQDYPLDGGPGVGNAPLLSQYRAADPVPFTQTQTQYTPDTSTEIQALLFCDNLVGYEALQISDYRPGILSAWGNLANFVIGDMVSYDYINQLISFNSPSSRAPAPVTAPPGGAPVAGEPRLPTEVTETRLLGRGVPFSVECVRACVVDAAVLPATTEGRRPASLGARRLRRLQAGVAKLVVRLSPAQRRLVREQRPKRLRVLVNVADAETFSATSRTGRLTIAR